MKKSLVLWTVALVLILGALSLLAACQPAAPVTPTPAVTPVPEAPPPVPPAVTPPPKAPPAVTPVVTPPPKAPPVVAPAAPPNLPANHTGRTTCKVCHEQGVAGAPKWPAATHAAFPDALATCQACHKGP